MTEQSMFEKNLEMWEKFVNANMDLMFKSMEKTMEGSAALQKQVSETVDKAVEESGAVQEQVSQAVNKTLEGSQALQEQVAKGVSAAVSTQFDLTLKALKALERQVEHLSERVDEFIEARNEE
jgi:hypothetical protein